MPIVFENVSYDYGHAEAAKKGMRAPQALRDVSLIVPDGEFLAIVGHTGSGKSTLAQHMNGLLQPTSGKVRVNGLDLSSKANRRTVRKYVGLTFQYPEHQLFAPTVAQDVAFGPRNLGVGEQEVSRRVKSSLAHLGLDYDSIADASPFELSGGQQRRVAIAGILAMHPQVLVLDEPMAGLDPKGRKEMMGHVRHLHDDLGLSIVMVSHSMEDVAEHASMVLVLSEGRVVMHDTPQNVFCHASKLHEIGLGIPRAAKFANELRARGLALPEGIITLKGLADALAAQAGPCSKQEYMACLDAISAGDGHV